MSTTTNRRISLVAAGALLTGTAAAATFGLLGVGAAGAAPAPQPAQASTAHMRTVDHSGKGSPDRVRLDAWSGTSRDKHGSREHYRDHKRDGSREHKRDGSRDHSRDHKWDGSRNRSGDRSRN